MKTIILGIGNEILSDDGIGARIVNDLARQLSDQDLFYEKSATSGLDIIHMIQDYHKLIVIDGIYSANGHPGEVNCYNLENYPSTLHLDTFHDSHFRDVIDLAKKVGISVPGDILIITVEIVDDITFSHKLSPPLEKSYPCTFQEARNIIENFKNQPLISYNYETV